MWKEPLTTQVHGREVVMNNIAEVNDSILMTVRKLVGGEENGTAFDTDLLVHINAVLEIIRQLGVGPEEGFIVTGESETWSDFLGDEIDKFRACVSYMILRVRLMFDPPSNSFSIESFKEIQKELEWRLTVDVDERK